MSRNNSRGAVGSLHPILFFAFVYGISLALAFFICNAVYNSMHMASAEGKEEQPIQQAPAPRVLPTSSATAMR